MPLEFIINGERAFSHRRGALEWVGRKQCL
jgi:hypothetical protein